MDLVLNWLWQGGVLAAALWLMLVVLRRARANVRYVACWAAVLAIMALPALLSMPSSPGPLGSLPGAGRDAIVSLPEGWWTSMAVVLGAWLIWVSIHAGQLLAAIAAIRRARARSRPFPSDLEDSLPYWRRVRSMRRRARLVLSDAVSTAAVFGWGAPIIAVAPRLVQTLNADELDRVLIHEWSHVQRRDDLINVLQVVVRMLGGWHPAVWWLDRRLHREREIGCDEATVAITGSPKSYAACLMKLASLGRAPESLRVVPAVLATSGLRARIVSILSPRWLIAPVASRAITAAAVGTVCVIAVVLSGLTVVEITAFTVPLVPRTLTRSMHRVQPLAVSAVTPPAVPIERSPRLVVRPARAVSSSDQPPAASNPAEDRNAAPAEIATARVDGLPTPESGAASMVGTPLSRVPPSFDSPARPNATGEQRQSPWTAAAAGGVAIGRKSKDAGVATAGFFTRFARHVAGGSE
ncbi:MAG TPA: M56 family metallopeptidase [Vicinamibacterales bacterium]|jgi:D-alanyl-D-alanine endopeptidase (penicillin-binding protein 7)|nr:M56 family metallopeptidase [Vicinamibacterales bacterium]